VAKERERLAVAGEIPKSWTRLENRGLEIVQGGKGNESGTKKGQIGPEICPAPLGDTGVVSDMITSDCCLFQNIIANDTR